MSDLGQNIENTALNLFRRAGNEICRGVTSPVDIVQGITKGDAGQVLGGAMALGGAYLAIQSGGVSGLAMKAGKAVVMGEIQNGLGEALANNAGFQKAAMNRPMLGLLPMLMKSSTDDCLTNKFGVAAKAQASFPEASAAPAAEIPASVVKEDLSPAASRVLAMGGGGLY